MKIYINNFDYSRLNIDYDTTYNQHFIYSNEGIYGFKNNKLFTVELDDKEVETRVYKNHDFLIDLSELSFNDEVYHIPYEHLLCIETINKKNIGHGITFVKRFFFDQTSHHFEIDGKLESFMFAKMFKFII